MIARSLQRRFFLSPIDPSLHGTNLVSVQKAGNETSRWKNLNLVLSVVGCWVTDYCSFFPTLSRPETVCPARHTLCRAVCLP